MKKIAQIIGLVLTFAVIATPVFAATPTPTPSASPTTKTATSSANPTTVQQNIKDRIERILDEKGEDAATLAKKKAYVGKVERVTTDFITFTTLSGTSVTSKIDSKTTVLSFPKMGTVQLADIEIDGFVIVMGYMQDDVFEARRILVSQTQLFPTPKRIIIGTVKSITSTTMSIDTATETGVAVKLSTKTLYENSTGDAAKRTDIKVDQRVLTLYKGLTDASASASLVRILK